MCRLFLEISRKAYSSSIYRSKDCKAIEEFNPIIIQVQSNHKAWYVCCNCYEKEGGHLYRKPGWEKKVTSCYFEEKHKQDPIISLKLISK